MNAKWGWILVGLVSCVDAETSSSSDLKSTTETAAGSKKGSDPPRSNAPGAGSYDGVWDVTSATDVLESGKTGQLTIAGGSLSADLPASNPYGDENGCQYEARLRFSLKLVGGAGTGQLSREKKALSQSTGCTAGSADWQLVAAADVHARRTSGGEPGTHAVEGRWEIELVSEGKTAESFALSVAGLSFNMEGSSFAGKVDGDRATASQEDFAFAARRR